jgi:hypothetical protein
MGLRRHHPDFWASLAAVVACIASAQPVFGAGADIAVAGIGPGLYPSDTVFVTVELDERLFVKSWTEYNTSTCREISTGSFTAPVAPQFGVLSFGVEKAALSSGPCAGTVLPFARASYKWTATSAAGAVDFFSLQWTTPDGQSVEDSDQLAELLPPSGTTAFRGWASVLQAGTTGQWMQVIAPAGIGYGGVTVQETDPGGGGPDTCWFAGSKFTPFTSITGGLWTVHEDNSWGFDYVGWFPPAVAYYRKNGRAPCGTTFPQQMQIQFTSGDTNFYDYGPVNTLGGSITSTTVSSIRAGHTRTRNWP